MDEPLKHGTKQKKPGTKDPILCDSIHMKHIEQINS